MKLPAPRYTVTDESHKYTIALKDGSIVGPLKSVTTILNVIEKPALKGWAARMSADYFKKEILRIGANALRVDELDRIAKDAAKAHTVFAKDAADLGSACHDAFEAIILGKEIEAYPKELQEPVAAFKAWRLGPGSDIEIVDTETAVASHRFMVGGRLDAIGYSEARGGWGIIDYKTSSGFYGNEYAYQVSGYAILAEEMFGIKFKWGEIIRFAKKPPFESEGRSITDMEKAADGFLAALELVRINGVKLIADPSFTSAGKPLSKDVPSKKDKNVKSAVGF